ncbi:MAG: winged helix-turn-helix transcriptional regulator [Minwuia sp.]|uniref:winged helix-turn-helix transcriptional regulator n=1 Tax=Minwuia sp. TaxID=2493630 RepID=UPI003A8554DA
MAKSDLSRRTCTVARTAEIIGDSWSQMIIHEMFLGTRRFDGMQRLTGASPHLISVRLKRLEAEGIVRKEAYSTRPLRHEYRLTEKGRDLWPVIIAMKNWGDRWMETPDATPITLTHTECGHETRPYLVCSACEAPIGAVTTRATISDEMQAERRSVLND